MSLVVDASLALSWYFEDERTSEGDAVLTQVVADGAVVPPLWRLEIANGFQMAVRRKRIDIAFRDRPEASRRSTDPRRPGLPEARVDEYSEPLR